MDTLLKDIRYAFRRMLRSRGFTVIALLSLAVGIGTNTAVFTLVEGFLFPTFPYDQDEPIGQAEAYDLSAYAGQDVRVQFRYHGDGWNWWAQVDNVSLGVPSPGALALLALAGLAILRRR